MGNSESQLPVTCITSKNQIKELKACPTFSNESIIKVLNKEDVLKMCIALQNRDVEITGVDEVNNLIWINNGQLCHAETNKETSTLEGISVIDCPYREKGQYCILVESNTPFSIDEYIAQKKDEITACGYHITCIPTRTDLKHSYKYIYVSKNT